jgi:hypothetical protein
MYFPVDNGRKHGIIQIVIIHKKIIFYAAADPKIIETHTWQGDHAGDDYNYSHP